MLETFITPCIELSPLELVKQGCVGKTTFLREFLLFSIKIHPLNETLEVQFTPKI